MSRSLTASIVTYKNDPEVLAKTIESVLTADIDVELHILDNSPTDKLSSLCGDSQIKYVHNKSNLGFGKAHNLSMRQTIDRSKYHLVLNPDVFFNGRTLCSIFDYMEDNPAVGQVMPKVLNLDGSVQYQCKLLPTPFTMIARRFLPFLSGLQQRVNFRYEMQFTSYDEVMEVPFLSGCFMFFRNEALKRVGLFDERMFLYVEDTDLSRRMGQRYKTIYFPDAHVYHVYGRGSRRDLRLMFHNSHSAIIYFNKWGWFFDPERKKVNDAVLNRHRDKTEANRQMVSI